MKKTFYLLMLIGMAWFLINPESQAQEKSQRPSVGSANGKNTPIVFNNVHALSVDASGRVVFLATPSGVFRSGDGARSWQKVALFTKQSDYDVVAVTPDPRDAKTIYVTTQQAGVLKSTDGGLSWKEINTGIRGPGVHGLAIDANSPLKLYAAVRGKGEGIYRTEDGGVKWRWVNAGPQREITLLTSVNISTGMGGIFLYAGTAEGLYRSPDCF